MAFNRPRKVDKDGCRFEAVVFASGFDATTEEVSVQPLHIGQ